MTQSRMTRYVAIIPAATKRGLDEMARAETKRTGEPVTTSALVRRILVKAEREGRQK